ncbi:nitrite reductase small subunit NirD [Fulvimarina uroteuthidis]|uniref:nitrite reductase small subunit NirD n=1 Tax=Fulvimarina uroteuthidis TaxID=3098149 RepID=UPI003A102E00
MDKHWIGVGRIADIPPLGARRIEAGFATIGLFRTARDEIFAIEDRCPHKGGPLTQGIVHDGCVTCPLHNMVIGLESGEAQGADEGRVTTFRVRMVDGEIQLSGEDLARAANRACAAEAA